MTIHIPSGAKLIKRVPRSPDAPYACIDADHVPTDTPAIVAFGGHHATRILMRICYNAWPKKTKS